MVGARAAEKGVQRPSAPAPYRQRYPRPRAAGAHARGVSLALLMLVLPLPLPVAIPLVAGAATDSSAKFAGPMQANRALEGFQVEPAAARAQHESEPVATGFR